MGRDIVIAKIIPIRRNEPEVIERPDGLYNVRVGFRLFTAVSEERMWEILQIREKPANP